jgi:hypothetical protein
MINFANMLISNEYGEIDSHCLYLLILVYLFKCLFVEILYSFCFLKVNNENNYTLNFKLINSYFYFLYQVF